MANILGLDNAKIHYEVYGQGDPSLIFVHGWAGHSGLWKHQLEYFSSFSRVIGIDLRGQGRSGWNDDTGGRKIFDIFISDIESLIQNLGLKQAVYIGWSMGAMLGLIIAARQTPWLKGLVLVGGTPKFLKTDDFSAGLEEDIAGRIKKHFEKHPAQTLKSCFSGYLSQQEKNLPLEDNIVLPHVDGAVKIFDELCQIDLRDELKNIEVPTLICHGTADEVCPPQAAMYLKDFIKISRLEYFEGAGHVPFFTEPDRFNKILNRFCNIFFSRSRFEEEASEILRRENLS